MLVKSLIAIAAVMTAEPVAAKSVALLCSIPAPHAPTELAVQLHEDQGVVDYEIAHSGLRVSKRAIFTPSGVRFGSFDISRQTLVIRRFNNDTGFVTPGLPDLDTGTCRIDDRPRAF